jgi:hypothetical protein
LGALNAYPLNAGVLFLEFTMLVGVNLVFYNNSPSGKQRNLRTSRQNSEALVITMAIFTKSVIGLKSAKIQKGQH